MIGDRHEYRVVADKFILHWLQFLEIDNRDKYRGLPRAQIWQPSFEIFMLECSKVVGWWRLILDILIRAHGLMVFRRATKCETTIRKNLRWQLSVVGNADEGMPSLPISLES
jgi:hypothetical protein